MSGGEVKLEGSNCKVSVKPTSDCNQIIVQHGVVSTFFRHQVAWFTDAGGCQSSFVVLSTLIPPLYFQNTIYDYDDLCLVSKKILIRLIMADVSLCGCSCNMILTYASCFDKVSKWLSVPFQSFVDEILPQNLRALRQMSKCSPRLQQPFSLNALLPSFGQLDQKWHWSRLWRSYEDLKTEQ